jgi:hypothetical protein
MEKMTRDSSLQEKGAEDSPSLFTISKDKKALQFAS